MLVSLRGCELKYDEYVPRTRIWSSSPKGVVIWNDGAAIEATMPSVRLLVGMWVVILKVRLKNTWKKVFVPSRRRELKYTIRNKLNDEKCSSPCGDVSCNIPLIEKFKKKLVRLRKETWIEMLMFLNICSMYMVRLLTETWVEICFFFVHFLYLLVRLLTETWVEM